MREGEGGGPLAELRRNKVEEVVVQGIFHFCYTYLLGIVYFCPGEMESDCSFFFFQCARNREKFLSLPFFAFDRKSISVTDVSSPPTPPPPLFFLSV